MTRGRSTHDNCVYPSGRRNAQWLLDFVSNHMKMGGTHQPVIIAALVRASGALTGHELAIELLKHDEDAVRRATETIARWPRSTLTHWDILTYSRKDRTYTLTADLGDPAVEDQIVKVCESKVENWRSRPTVKNASRRYAVIARADGRCQACGIPGSEQLLDVDHIVPQRRATSGKVLKDGVVMDVDDLRNLQLLCISCNRGKRDADDTDYKPSIDRLTQTLRLVLQRGEAAGYTRSQMLARADEGE